jgi:hypothetical protein
MASADSNPQALTVLSLLDGNWFVQVTPIVVSRCGAAYFESILGRFTAHAVLRHSPEGDLTCTYSIAAPASASSKAKLEWQIILRPGVLEGINVGFSDGAPLVPAKKATWSQSSLLLVSDFQDAWPLWNAIAASRPYIKGRPSVVSVVIRRFSDSSWLLDVGFTIPDDDSSKPPKEGFCRVEHRHTRVGAANPPPTAAPFVTTRDVKDAAQRIEDAKQDLEFGIGDIDDLIASLEDARDRLVEKATTTLVLQP